MTLTVLEHQLPQSLDSVQLKLTVLSPLYIGEAHYKPLQYISEAELLNIIVTENLYEDWINFFTKNKAHTHEPLYYEKFLISHPRLKARFKQQDQTSGFIKTCYKPYIPGSTVKGAMATALLSQILLKTSDKTASKVSLDTHSPEFMNAMKCLRISDSVPISESALMKREVRYKSVLSAHKMVGLRTYHRKEFEFLKPGTEVTLTFTLDTHAVQSLPEKYQDIFQSSTSILQTVEKHYQSILKDFQHILHQSTIHFEYKSEEDRLEARAEYVRQKFPKGLRDPNRITENVRKLEQEFDEAHPKIPRYTDSLGKITVYNNALGLIPTLNIGGLGGFETKISLKAMAHNNFKEYDKLKKEALNQRYKSHDHPKAPRAPRYLKIVDTYTPGWCHLGT